MTMNESVVMGYFNSENFWKEENRCELPSLRDKEAEHIVEAMDEMLFVLCEKEDILLTQYPMEKCLRIYLDGIGFSFENKCLSKETDVALMQSLKDRHLKTYAILPETKAFCERYNVRMQMPSIACVKKVNSKSYSTKIYKEIGLQPIGQVITSLETLLEEGSKLLKQGAFLIKEPMGVSGKGNLLIDHEKTLLRMQKHFTKQIQKGKQLELIIEPLLNKKIDFSCEFQLNQNGHVEILSIQKIVNKGFGYLGSITADKAFQIFLEKQGYFEIISKVGAKLHKEGYFGSVCVDAMVLEDDTLIPIVEINARKSMGFINYYIEQKILKYGYQSMLTFLSLGYEGKVAFEDFFSALKAAGLLFSIGGEGRVLPLSSHTLTINGNLSEDTKIHKGRLYVAILYKAKEAPEVSLEKLKAFCLNYGMKLYN